MEYKGIWIVFLTVCFLLGASVAVFPVVVARLLRGGRGLPPSRLLAAASERRDCSGWQRVKAGFSSSEFMSEITPVGRRFPAIPSRLMPQSRT